MPKSWKPLKYPNKRCLLLRVCSCAPFFSHTAGKSALLAILLQIYYKKLQSDSIRGQLKQGQSNSSSCCSRKLEVAVGCCGGGRGYSRQLEVAVDVGIGCCGGGRGVCPLLGVWAFTRWSTPHSGSRAAGTQHSRFQTSMNAYRKISLTLCALWPILRSMPRASSPF